MKKESILLIAKKLSQRNLELRYSFNNPYLGLDGTVAQGFSYEFLEDFIKKEGLTVQKYCFKPFGNDGVVTLTDNVIKVRYATANQCEEIYGQIKTLINEELIWDIETKDNIDKQKIIENAILENLISLLGYSSNEDSSFYFNQYDRELNMLSKTLFLFLKNMVKHNMVVDEKELSGILKYAFWVEIGVKTFNSECFDKVANQIAEKINNGGK